MQRPVHARRVGTRDCASSAYDGVMSPQPMSRPRARPSRSRAPAPFEVLARDAAQAQRAHRFDQNVASLQDRTNVLASASAKFMPFLACRGERRSEASPSAPTNPPQILEIGDVLEVDELRSVRRHTWLPCRAFARHGRPRAAAQTSCASRETRAARAPCASGRARRSPVCLARRRGRRRRRPRGRRSTIQSASASTSRLCSMTMTLLPASTSRCSTRTSFSTSAMCSPIVGSSSTYKRWRGRARAQALGPHLRELRHELHALRLAARQRRARLAEREITQARRRAAASADDGSSAARRRTRRASSTVIASTSPMLLPRN